MSFVNMSNIEKDVTLRLSPPLFNTKQLEKSFIKLSSLKSNG